MAKRPATLEEARALAHPLRVRILRLCLDEALTNKQIADALYIAERTVDTHVEHILAKLDFQSRSQVAAWTVERGLLTAGEE